MINFKKMLSVLIAGILLLSACSTVPVNPTSPTDTEQTKVTEEEEISVESLLQSDPEPVLEDIEVETKSETRKMVEKFVDENPEAAVNLLRNWLNEEWG